MSAGTVQIKWAVDLQTQKLVKADRAEHRPGKGRYESAAQSARRDLLHLRG
jgi:hypothetical protein